MVSNLDNALGDAWTIGRDDFDLTDSPVANRFTTGSGHGWYLDSVELNLGRFEGATDPAIDDIDGILLRITAVCPGLY